MIIELIGVPYSGKTSIVRRFYENQNQFGETVYYPLNSFYKNPWIIRTLYKMGFVIISSLKRPKLSSLVLKNLLVSRQNSIIEVVRLYFNYLFLLYYYLKYKRMNGLVLMEEGIFQTLCTIFTIDILDNSELKIELFSKIVVKELVPDILVNVQAEDNLIVERFNRHLSENQSKRSIDKIKKIFVAKTKIERLIEYADRLMSHNETRIIKVKNNTESDIDLIIKKIIVFKNRIQLNK